jgi:hypothetical protein
MADKQVLLEGMKLIRRLAKVAPLSDYLLDSDVPLNYAEASDEVLNDHIDKCEPSTHPAGLVLTARLRDDLPPNVVLQNRQVPRRRSAGLC